ncbi:hypothetical protein [Streptomyces sp. MMG1121]|uniref:hypothetical protein n=1 Tax=Streptomyces sp. MMG1121 TaxID=1415544 RepID=UPI000ABDFB7E|nr:hypothetical protein [Streptomyces sp. MMG1121]
MRRHKRWWSRAVVGAVLLTLAGVMPAFAETAATKPNPAGRLDLPPSATPAAGPELQGKALAAVGGGGRPVSGKNPEAGPTWERVGGKWQVDRTTVTLRNTVTDPDGDQSDLTFDVWTVNADGSPKAHVDTDKNQYGMPVSGYVKSGSKAFVTIGYGYLHPGWTYAFRTSAFDGSLYEQVWSPWATFTVRGHAVDITLPEPDKNAAAVDLAKYQEPQVTNDHVNSSPGGSTSLTRNKLPAPLGKGCQEAGDKIYCATVGKPADMTPDERSHVTKGLRAIGASNLVSWCDGAAIGKDYIKRTEGCVKKANEITNTVYTKLPNGEIWPVGRAIFASQIEIKTDIDSNTFTQQWSLKPLSFRDAAGTQTEWGPITINPKFSCETQCTTSAPTWSAPPTWSTTGVDYHDTTATFTHTVTDVTAGNVVPVQLIWKWDYTVPDQVPDAFPDGDIGNSVPDLDIRCDAVATATPGCVFSAYKPTWVMNFKKFPAAVAHAWMTQAKLPNHPGSKTADKPLVYLPAKGSASGRTPTQNRAVICPSGWAAKSGNPDTTTLPGNTPKNNDPMSCDEFSYASTYNSGGMPAPDGLNPVSSGDQCVQTYSQRTQTDVWHFYDDMRQAAPTWKEVCARSAMSNWMNTQSMQPFPTQFTQPNRLLDRDAYWYYAPEFAGCSATAATVKCTVK